MSVRLAVFDCDGTLVDGQAPICAAMAEAFAFAGLPAPEPRDVRRIVGLSLPQAITLLAPDAEADARADAVAGYKTAYRTAREEGRLAEPLYAGIAEVVAALAGAGWTLGVATGKSDRGLAHCLSANGIATYFATLQTADRHPSKPHPAMLQAAMDAVLAEPEGTVMIGDTAYDMAMAKSCGVRAIGVAWGYHEMAELSAAGAEFVARTPAELREFLLA